MVDSPVVDELQEYRKNIEYLMNRGSSELISNKQPEHAAALYQLFFQEARHSVDIFCQDLRQDVFDLEWVRDAFKNALERGVSVRILIQREAPHQEPLLSSIRGSRGEMPDYKYADETVGALDFNFAVMDSRAYRYEPNKAECAAFAKLSDRKQSSQLKGVFSTLWG